MNPLRQDDPRHVKAVEVATVAAFDREGINVLADDVGHARKRLDESVTDAIAAYHESLKAQGVVLVEAYAGDDAGRT